ncbi:MAG: 2OG-Fe(II) oxygenase family protein [Thermohalobaculum sp.]|nr:2OG-Fe(II) oxygenase family protein [Thermohalobaculum sp.]
MTDIPRIPARPLVAPASGADWHQAVAAVTGAATGSGFMTLAGVEDALGLPADIHARLLRFFTLPDDTKLALARQKFMPANRNVYRGLFPVQNGETTCKEGIDIGPDLIDPARAGDGADPLTEPTPLPPEAALPGWRTDAVAYYTAMERLGRALCRALTQGLGAPAGALEPLFVNGISTLRLIRYPERTPDTLPADRATVTVAGETRMIVGAPHCDSGFVTLLWQDPTGGLQARGPDGGWRDVPPIPGGLAVNFGRMLSDWSGGRVKATEHRVLGGLKERCSIPFFFEPAVDARIVPLGGAEPFVYGDKLWEWTTRFVEFRGVQRHRAA